MLGSNDYPLPESVDVQVVGQNILRVTITPPHEISDTGITHYNASIIATAEGTLSGYFNHKHLLDSGIECTESQNQNWYQGWMNYNNNFKTTKQSMLGAFRGGIRAKVAGSLLVDVNVSGNNKYNYRYLSALPFRKEYENACGVPSDAEQNANTWGYDCAALDNYYHANCDEMVSKLSGIRMDGGHVSSCEKTCSSCCAQSAQGACGCGVGTTSVVYKIPVEAGTFVRMVGRKAHGWSSGALRAQLEYWPESTQKQVNKTIVMDIFPSIADSSTNPTKVAVRSCNLLGCSAGAVIVSTSVPDPPAFVDARVTSETGLRLVIRANLTRSRVTHYDITLATMLSKGNNSVHLFDVGQNEFDQRAAAAANDTLILWRKCSTCPESHKNVYYRRKTPFPEGISIYHLLHHTWASHGNMLDTDFGLFSTFEDARDEVNGWKYCNYDHNGVGFPRDCGVTERASCTWQGIEKRFVEFAAACEGHQIVAWEWYILQNLSIPMKSMTTTVPVVTTAVLTTPAIVASVSACNTVGCNAISTTGSTAAPCSNTTGTVTKEGLCWACSPGQFSPPSDFTRCIPMTNAYCPPGQGFFSASSISSNVGFYGATRDDGSCTACPQGQSKSTKDASRCIPCEAGKFQNETGGGFCHICTAGKFSNTKSEKCTPCFPGYYANEAGQFACKVCAAGTYEDKYASTNCLKCPPGTHLVDDTGTPTAHDHLEDCRPCPVLSYNPLEGLGDNCYPCLTTRVPGSETCEGCDPGKYRLVDEQGNYSCVVCSPGKFTNLRNQAACKPCEQGRFAPKSETVICLLCARGKHGIFHPAGAASLTEGCADCPRGTFSDVDGLFSVFNCTDCVAGFWSADPGINKESLCKSCEAGKYSETPRATNQDACLDCKPGLFSVVVATASSSTCQECPIGYAQSEGGSVFCLPCQPGNVAPRKGSRSCRACPRNTVAKKSRSSHCAPCNPGEFTTGNGSVLCSKCIPGTFKSNLSDTCLDCPRGFVSAKKSATACDVCGPGKFTNGNGSVVCLNCHPGRFKIGIHMETCSNCPRGFVSEVEGATACLKCPLATYTMEEGKSVCTLCDVGKFGRTDGLCSFCAPGFFQDEKKMTSCKLCPEGRYSDEVGATAQAQCTFCAQDRTTGHVTGASNITSCICKAHLFFQQDTEEIILDDDGLESLPVCNICPEGGVCPIDGTRRIHIHAQTNFWQPLNISTEFIDCATAFTDQNLGRLARTRCCPPEARCNRVPRSGSWTTDDQCAIGYSGPLCVACAKDFVLFGGACIECDGGSPLWAGIVGLLAVGLALFVVVFVMLKRKTQSSDATEETRVSRLSGLVSITISWLQILSALTVTYKLAWPSKFAAYSKGTGAIVNLEVFSFLAISNCALSVPFINKFLLQIMTPLVFGASVGLAWIVLKCCHGKKLGWKRVQRARSESAMQITIMILQLLYPKLCTRTFQMFRCIDLGPRIGLQLEADFSKKCFEGVHAAYVPLAFASVVGYLVGVPLATFVIIWRHRKVLHTPKVEGKYGDLYRQVSRFSLYINISISIYLSFIFFFHLSF